MVQTFWLPAEDFAQALQLWPEFAAEWPDFDHTAYCRRGEAFLRDLAGLVPILIVVAVRIPEYRRWCAEHHLDPADSDTHARYAVEGGRDEDRTMWPPQLDQHCWCRSGQLYRVCCGVVLYDHPLAESTLPDQLQQYVRAQWIERRCLLAERPDLLGDAATRLIRRSIEAYQQDGLVEEAEGNHRLIADLARAREVGIDAMVAEWLLRQLADDDRWPEDTVRDAATEVSRAAYPMQRQATPEAHVAYTHALEHLITELRNADWPAAAQRQIRHLLCEAFVNCFLVTRHPADLDAAITVMAATADELPETDPYRQADHLHELGVLCAKRQQVAADPAVVERGIAALTEALDCAPEDWDGRGACAKRLAELHESRYQQWGSYRDLSLAIDRYLEATTSISPEREPSVYVATVNQRALALRKRFLRRGNLTDLDEGIQSLTTAQRTAWPNPEDEYALRTNLGMQLRLRYESLGRTSDLERAIQAHQHITRQDASQAGPERVFALNNLGVALLSRYLRLNEQAELDRAVELLTQAVADSPANSPVHWERVHNLTSALVERATWTHHTADVEHVLAVLDDAASDPPDDPQLAAVQLAWRAIMVAERSHTSGRTDDIELAIRLGEQALGALSAVAEQRPRLLDALARTLIARHTHTHVAADLDRALELSEFAIRVPFAQVLYLPSQLATLAAALSARYEHYGDSADLARAVEVHRQIADHLDKGDLRARLSAALACTGWALRREAWDEARKAADAVLRAAARLAVVWLDADLEHTWPGHPATPEEDLATSADSPIGLRLRQARDLLSEPARNEARAALDTTHHTDAVRRFHQSIHRMRALDRSSLDRLPNALRPQHRARTLARGWQDVRAATAAASDDPAWHECRLLVGWSASTQLPEKTP